MAKTDENTPLNEMNEEERNQVVRKYEDDILGGLIAAASYKLDDDENAKIEITRSGAVVLCFTIHPLSEEEYLKCKKNNTNYRRNKQVGTRVAESVDASRYRSELIYTATIAEDREKIWDNRKAWEKLSVVNGIDMIDVVLKAGEKNIIIDKIDDLSGYDMEMEDTAKN